MNDCCCGRAIPRIWNPLLASLLSDYPDRDFLQRLQQGNQRCYLALSEGRLAAFAWVSTAPCYVSELCMILPVGQGSLYIYDCLVYPRFRGHGIYQELLKQILYDHSAHRAEELFKIACIGAEPGNIASIKGIQKAGFQQCAHVRHIKTGPLVQTFGTRNLLRIMDPAPDARR